MAPRAWARVLLAAALIAGGGEARADPLRVLVVAGGERELAARIQGQTADLDAVVTVSDGELPPDPTGRLALARGAAARADAVIWFGRDGGDWIAYIASGERVLARRITGASGALSRSASIEAVALAVRTAVRGLAGGVELDVEQPEPRHRCDLRAWAELGWTGVLDGEASSGRSGVVARFGGAGGRWRLGAALGYQPAATIRSSRAAIQVGRQQAGLLLGFELLDPFPPAQAALPRWSLGLGLELGAVRFSRATSAAAVALAATPARSSWSPVAGLALRLGRRVTPGSWLTLDLGGDFLGRPPEFGVAGPYGFERIAALRAVEPRAALSLLFDSP